MSEEIVRLISSIWNCVWRSIAECFHPETCLSWEECEWMEISSFLLVNLNQQTKWDLCQEITRQNATFVNLDIQLLETNNLGTGIIWLGAYKCCQMRHFYHLLTILSQVKSRFIFSDWELFDKWSNIVQWCLHNTRG